MKKNNIGVLITIIILLCIFVPASIYGTYMHFISDSLDGNNNKDFYYNGKLYFYDGDTLLGKYTCVTEECGYAKNSINNQSFEDYNTEESEIGLINKHYAFISDGDKIVLYDVKTETSIITYKEIKNYSLGIENDYYFVKNTSDLWGMIKVADNINVAIPNNYQYLGLNGNLTEENKYEANRIIAQTQSEWQLLTDQNNIVTNIDKMIVDYSDYFIATDDNKIYDYNSMPIFEQYQLSNIKLLNTLAIALINNNTYYVYDSKKSNIVGSIPVTSDGEYTFEIQNNMLLVSIDGSVLKTIALS